MADRSMAQQAGLGNLKGGEPHKIRLRPVGRRIPTPFLQVRLQRLLHTLAVQKQQKVLQ